MAKCRLTERITIEKYSGEMQDENGFDEPKWDTYYECWSNFRAVSGKEYEAAKATQTENIVTFMIRHCKKSAELLKKDSTKNYRIKYKDKLFDIDYVYDYENLHDWVYIKAAEA